MALCCGTQCLGGTCEEKSLEFVADLVGSQHIDS